MSDSSGENARPESLPLDESKALALVSPFFGDEWAGTEVNDIHIEQLTDGMVNTLHLIRRDSPANTEPSAVLVRHFGQEGYWEEPRGNSITLSASQQAVVYWEMGRRGWGPQIYGFFPGGRLEEYIDSQTLTAAQSTQPHIQRDVAHSYARLHSLKLPLSKDQPSQKYRELSRCAEGKHEEVEQALSATDDPMLREYAMIALDVNWSQELDWMWSLFEKHHCKVRITQGDTNFLNVLVKNFEAECRIVLIDYETVSYSYRGFDIGGHFTGRMYRYNQPDSKLTGYPAPSIEEQRSFCEAYLQAWQDLGESLSEHDTVDHLVLEATIGRLYQNLFACLLCPVRGDDEVDHVSLSGLLHRIKGYKQLKLEFAGIL